MSDEYSARDAREQQLDAIIAAYYRVVEAGECIDQKDFIAKYPEVQKELSDFFADLGMLNAASPQDQHDPALEPTITAVVSDGKALNAGAQVRYFGAYEILEELGSGGMGVVYKARHSRLRKFVALKMIRARELATENEVRMFEAEARAAAKLDYPNIVAVHEVGVHADQHFYSMDYVVGGSLSRLHRDEPVQARHAAELVRQLAEAIHYAHGRGIVHRDLKPANILLTSNGVPRITDFGLAKRLWADEDSVARSMTETGQILGTAGYMSPEQAEGKTRLVGPPADIYALGAVLYALLTSRAPFVGESQADTIRQVIHREPVSPRVLNPTLPRDIETICLKCLSKERHARYGTAQLLAEDLSAFLDGRPIVARPLGYVGRTVKWVRRHQMVSALLMLLGFSMIAGTAFSIYFAVESQQQSIQTQKAKENVEAAKKETDNLLTRTTELFQESQRQLYQVRLAAATNEWESGSPLMARTNLAACPESLRSWEYYALARLLMSDSTVLADDASYPAMAVSSDGQLVATYHQAEDWASRGQVTLKIRDARNGAILRAFPVKIDNIHAVTFSPDSSQLAVAGKGPIKLFDTKTGQLTGELNGHQKGVISLTFSFDGSVLTSGGMDGQVKVWDPGLLNELKTLPHSTTGGGIFSVAMSPNGKLAASTRLGATLKFWDMETGECLDSVNELGAFDLAFLSDHELIIGCTDGTVRLWDLNLRVCRQVFYGHEGSVVSVASVQDPPRIVSAGVDGTIRLWNPETCLPERVIHRQEAKISRVATVRGSTWLVFGSYDRKVTRREIFESSQPLAFKTETQKVTESVFSSDGRRIFHGTRDGKVAEVSLETGKPLRTINVGSSAITCVSLNKSDTLMAVAAKDKTIRVLDAISGQTVHTFEGIEFAAECLAFSPIAPVVAAGDYKSIRMWNHETGRQIGHWRAHEFTVGKLKFGPDGKKLYSASISGGHGVNVWDAETLEKLFSPGGRHQTSALLELTEDGRFLLTSGPRLWNANDGSLFREFTTKNINPSAAISPDGERIAVVDAPRLRVFEVKTGSELLGITLPAASGTIPWTVQFGPDGDRLLAESSFSLMVWDGSPLPDARQSNLNSETSEPSDEANLATTNSTLESELTIEHESSSTVLEGHANLVSDVAFSPDGTRMATASWDETIRIWNTESDQPELLLKGHDHHVNAVSFGPDGQLLASASNDASLIIWNAVSGKQVHQLRGHDQWVNDIAISPDGLRIASCGRDGTIRFWDIKTGSQLYSVIGSSKAVTSIAFSPDGKQLMSGDGEGSVRIWDNETKKELRNLKLHPFFVRCVAYSSDGKLGASLSADKTACIFAAITGEELFRLNTNAADIEFSPDGCLLATCGAGTPPQLWDAQTGENVLNLDGRSSRYTSLAFSSDGKELASANADGSVEIWKLADVIFDGTSQ